MYDVNTGEVNFNDYSKAIMHFDNQNAELAANLHQVISDSKRAELIENE